jgi:hypothetical protein
MCIPLPGQPQALELMSISIPESMDSAFLLHRVIMDVSLERQETIKKMEIMGRPNITAVNTTDLVSVR